MIKKLECHGRLALFRASGRARGPCHLTRMHQGLRDSSYNVGYGFLLVSIAIWTLQSSRFGYEPAVKRKRLSDPRSGRRLIGEMAVNSRSQLRSLNQTANAEPTTRVGPRGCAGTPWEPSLDFRRRP